jgi:hypothetical protein
LQRDGRSKNLDPAPTEVLISAATLPRKSKCETGYPKEALVSDEDREPSTFNFFTEAG